MYFIYSTLSCDNEYRGYKEGSKDVPSVKWSVVIKGGANIASKNLITPKGVLTTVSDEEMALLETNAQFKRHVERGFLIVEKKKVEAEEVAKNMKKKDKSAPTVASDFKEDVVTNKE